jgi:hypothetical protein
MRYLPLLLLLGLLWPAVALAQSPTPEPSGYHFEVIDFSSAQTEKITGADFYAPEFINWTGSIGLTLVTLMSKNVVLSSLTILVVITLGLVFAFSILANRKIDSNISDMTMDIELNQSLAELTDSDTRVNNLEVRRQGMVREMHQWQAKKINYGKSYKDFRSLNNGKVPRKTKDNAWSGRKN